MAVNIGLTYPAVADLDNQYLKGLATPLGVMNYDQIFDRAMANVLTVWSSIANAIFKNDNATSPRSIIGIWIPEGTVPAHTLIGPSKYGHK